MRWLLACVVLGIGGLGCTCFNSTREVTPPAPSTIDPQCYKDGSAWEASCRKGCEGRSDLDSCEAGCRATAQQLYAKCPVVHATE